MKENRNRRNKKKVLAGGMILTGMLAALGLSIVADQLLGKQQDMALAYGSGVQQSEQLRSGGGWQSKQLVSGSGGRQSEQPMSGVGNGQNGQMVSGGEYQQMGSVSESPEDFWEMLPGDETESETESESESETGGRAEGAESGGGTEQESEGGTGRETAVGAENGSVQEAGAGSSAAEIEAGSSSGKKTGEEGSDEAGAEMKSGEEAGTQTASGGEKESEKEDSGETVTEPESGSGKEPEAGGSGENAPEVGDSDEAGGESESGSEKESEEESGNEDESEKEVSGETVIESESGNERESEEESSGEAGGEPESGSGEESEEESSNEDESEKEGSSETVTEPESSSEDASEAGDGGGAGGEPESAREEESEEGSSSEKETEPESGGEAETEPESANEAGTENNSKETDGDENTGDFEPVTESNSVRKPEKILRGQHYEIVGDQNAWFRDDRDHLWIRAGSNLYIETKQDSGYGRGPEMANLQQDGTLTFSLKKVDDQGTVLAESEIKQEDYFVDGEAPAADIVFSGSRLDGMVYSAGAASAEITVAPDGKSGLKSAAYSVVKCQEDGALLQQPEECGWTECAGRQQVNIREEGLFQIFVRTEDNVGNLAFSKSDVVCIDSTPPEIIVEGVEDQTANSGSVRLKISSRDSHYKTGTTQVDIIGVNQGRVPVASTRQETSFGVMVEYFDFPRQQGYDDIYHLSIRAEDMAGNIAEKELDFSVNRFGSVYDLSSETKAHLKQYFLTEAQDVVFYETNIDYVGESQIYCRRDGELRELERNSDYQVEMQGSSDSWKRYQYTIPADYFEEEGVYELLLSSHDRAENQSDTGMQKKQVAFVLDWTAPACTITGIAARQIYEAQSVTACLIPHDNIGVRTMKVYHNSKLLQEEGEPSGDDEAVKIPLDASEEWQTLQVYLCDMAGNEYWSDEIPVYINEKAAHAPEYRRLRPSARELIQGGRDEGEAGPVDGDDAGGEETLKSAGAAEPKRSNPTLLPGRRAEGICVLVLGVLMLAATAVSCFLSGIGRKK